MTILGRSLRDTESRGFLARMARANRRQSIRRSSNAKLSGVVTLVPVVDFAALRDLIDGNPLR
jgi:hypothetical protein